MKTGSFTLLLIAVIGNVAVNAPAAMAQAGLATQTEVTAGGAFETFRYSSPEVANVESISLLTLPFSVATPLFGPASIQARGAFARGAIVDAAGVETTLTGLVDTEFALGLTLGTGAYSTTITGIAIAPTGTSKHDEDEARIAGVVASEFLPFRITNWGTGGAVGLSATVARPLARGSVGVGVGYLAAREFDPFESGGTESLSYQPGDQMQIRLAADQDVGTSAKLSLALVFERHQEDQLDGTDLYRAGNRFQGMGSYAFAAGARATGIVYAGGLHTQDGVGFDQPLTHDSSSRTLLLLGGGMRTPIGAAVLVPSVDARVFRRGSGRGQGYMGGIGASLELPAGDFSIAPGARVRAGNYVVDDDLDSRIIGFDLGLDIRFR